MIAYYFPPVGCGGVQRTVKFVKYLPRFGWEPAVVTVKDKVYKKTNREIDKTFLKYIPKGTHIVRTNSIDLKKVSSTIKAQEESSSKRLSIKSVVNEIGGLLINPDAQMPWIPIAAWEGYKLISKYKIDMIYSTANPWSDHIVGAILCKVTGIPWVADYRDAWNLHPYVTQPSKIRKKIHMFLEKKILQYANRTIFTTDGTRNDYKRVFGNGKFVTIQNAFDPDDFISVRSKKSHQFTILYSGNIWPYTKPSFFINVVSQWLKKIPEARRQFSIDILGRYDRETKLLIDRHGLQDVIRLHGYLPHRKSISFLLGADVLLMTLDEGGETVIPGKVFEYLASGKTILALIPPQGMAADILRREGRGDHIVNPRDAKAIEERITVLYTAYKNNCLPIHPVDNLEEYTWSKATEKLVKVFHNIQC